MAACQGKLDVLHYAPCEFSDILWPGSLAQPDGVLDNYERCACGCDFYCVSLDQGEPLPYALGRYDGEGRKTNLVGAD